MVSFSCEVCNDTVVKKRLAQHQQRCRGSYFTCIDCNTTFYNNEHTAHTSCISEAEKYEKGLYKKKESKPAKQESKPVKQESQPAPKALKPEKESKPSKKDSSKKDSSKKESKATEGPLPQLKVNKPVSLKKALKDLSKEQQKALFKRLTVVRNLDDSVSFSYN